MTLTSAHTLYANWLANTYTVTYDGNGSTGGATANSAHTYDTAKSLTANGFTRTGHTFAGWATSASGAVAYANSASVLNLTSTPGTTVTLYAKWTANIYTLTFNAQGGAVSPATKQVTFGTAYGELPIPTRTDWYFAGWWTAANGAGTKMAPSTMYATDGNVTLYAYWVDDPALARNPYLSDPDGSRGRSPSITTAYEGFVYDTNYVVRGMVTLSAKAAVKVDKKNNTATTNWTFSAKATMQNATVSFSGKKEGVADRFVVETKTKEKLDVYVEGDRFYGTVSGGKVGGTLIVDGARNAFADRDTKVVAQSRLNNLMGLYNVAVYYHAADRWGETSLDVMGYLSLSVGNQGSVKIAGKLNDGTAVSGGAKLLEGLNGEGWYAIALHRPLYSNKGFVGGMLWLNPADKVIRVDTANGWFVDWVCQDPKKETFAYASESVVGGWFGDGKNVPQGVSLTGLTFGMHDIWWWYIAPDKPFLRSNWWESEAWPLLPVTANNATLSLPKATPPMKIGKGTRPQEFWDSFGDNPSCTTLSYTAKTGVFKGTFKMYWVGWNANWDFQLGKTFSVPYTGLIIPTRDGDFAGRPLGLGVGTATVEKQKLPVSVFLKR
jgi:uncharacterized repeat protein (TIGR02543 family)